jgi:hypothetical protein
MGSFELLAFSCGPAASQPVDYYTTLPASAAGGRVPGKKKKKKKFSVTKAVKAAARERIGTVPPTRSVPEKKKTPAEKHKPTLSKLLADSGEP